MAENKDIFDSLQTIAFHRVYVFLTGSVTAAVLLSQAVYWQKRAKQSDGCFYKTTAEWEEETGLTRHEQETARRQCSKYLKSSLRDIPARLYWWVDLETLRSDLLAEFSETSLPKIGKTSLTESGNLALRKAPNINKYTESNLQRAQADRGGGATQKKNRGEAVALKVETFLRKGAK